MEHWCKDCKHDGDNTCKLTGAIHTTGIECPSFGQKENEMNFRVRKTDDDDNTWTVADGAYFTDSENYIDKHGDAVDCCEAYETKKQAEDALALYLHGQPVHEFKIGDKVRVIADEERLRWCKLGKYTGKQGVISGYNDANVDLCYQVVIEGNHNSRNLGSQDLELVEARYIVAVDPAVPGSSHTAIRTFVSGATRDTAQGKLDYVKALSPIVLRRYVQYLDKHRLQPGGSYRDFDNWKKGMDQGVYLSSLGRHFIDVWLLAHGQETSDNHGPVDEESALCAILFNTMGILHEKLAEKMK